MQNSVQEAHCHKCGKNWEPGVGKPSDYLICPSCDSHDIATHNLDSPRELRFLRLLDWATLALLFSAILNYSSFLPYLPSPLADENLLRTAAHVMFALAFITYFGAVRFYYGYLSRINPLLWVPQVSKRNHVELWKRLIMRRAIPFIVYVLLAEVAEYFL